MVWKSLSPFSTRDSPIPVKPYEMNGVKELRFPFHSGQPYPSATLRKRIAWKSLGSLSTRDIPIPEQNYEMNCVKELRPLSTQDSPIQEIRFPFYSWQSYPSAKLRDEWCERAEDPFPLGTALSQCDPTTMKGVKGLGPCLLGTALSQCNPTWMARKSLGPLSTWEKPYPSATLRE